MNTTERILQCAVVSLLAASCSLSQFDPSAGATAELNLSDLNRADLEAAQEGGTAAGGDERSGKFTTARPELLVSDEKVHRPATHGLRNSMRLMRFQPVRTTAYNHEESDHLGYGVLTASGQPLSYGTVRSAAADWSRYPLGTRFRIIGDPDACEYVVNDYGSALVGTTTIDLYKPTIGRMHHWGVRDVVIEVIEWGSFAESREVMETRTEFAHVRQMVESIDRNGLTHLDAMREPAVREVAEEHRHVALPDPTAEVAMQEQPTNEIHDDTPTLP